MKSHKTFLHELIDPQIISMPEAYKSFLTYKTRFIKRKKCLNRYSLDANIKQPKCKKTVTEILSNFC